MRSRRAIPVALVAAIAPLAACRDAADPGSSVCTLTVSTTAVSLADAGALGRIEATARCERGPAPPIRWSTNAPGVVAVDSTTGALRAVAPGTALVTVSFAGASGGVTIPVTVVGRICGDVSSLHVALAMASTVIGGAFQLTARAQVRCDTAAAVTWVSADTTIAIVDSTGLVTGIRYGATAVSAIAREIPTLRAAMTVAVGATGVVYGLAVTPRSIALAAHDTARVRAAVDLWPGAMPDAPRGVTFRSRDSTVAHVDSTGLVTALRAGAATEIIVSAKAEPNVAQRVTVRVTPANP